MIVSSANPVSNLTMEQLRQVYEEKIVSWKALGGPDAKIEILTCEPICHGRSTSCSVACRRRRRRRW
jgi:hypothetical protein